VHVKPYILPLVLDVKAMDEDAWDAVLNTIEKERLEEKILLDPLFWQAIGRARGWKKNEFPTIQRCALTREGVEQFKNHKSGRTLPKTTGRVIGESRDKKCWTVIWEGHKSLGSYHKDFIYLFPNGDWKDQAKKWFETRMNNGNESDFWQSLP